MPESVTYIGSFAFHECDKLDFVIVPKNCQPADDAFPPACKVFNDVIEYRAYLAKNLAAERSGDVVDVVGMHPPLLEPFVDSRGGRDI